ncbi:hypothetical protein CHI10_10250 [Bacillus sp. 7894-2]|nr:hypothetical protein CHI10_10250 [Bacillus sp. 7894-2]
MQIDGVDLQIERAKLQTEWVNLQIVECSQRGKNGFANRWSGPANREDEIANREAEFTNRARSRHVFGQF